MTRARRGREECLGIAQLPVLREAEGARATMVPAAVVPPRGCLQQRKFSPVGAENSSVQFTRRIGTRE
jgi:hypothetical protein